MEIPGAMIAHSRSARMLIAAIMIGWGFLAAMTGLVQTATQFNIIRFLLGTRRKELILSGGDCLHDALVPASGSRQSDRTVHDGCSGFERYRRR